MADSRSAGVGGLPFAFSTKASPSSPSPSALPSSAAPSASPPAAESAISAAPLRPPPHLGPGGLPLAPQLSLPASLHPQPRIRGWSEKLIYETGTSYALGFFSGGLAGGGAGFVKALPGSNTKLRINAVLNGAGKASATYANSFAVFALMYSMSRSVSRWGYRKWVGEVGPPVGYQERDDVFEGLGVAIAGTTTAWTRMGLGRALTCGGVLGVLMVGGLKARRTLIDERGVKVPHI